MFFNQADILPTVLPLSAVWLCSHSRHDFSVLLPLDFLLLNTDCQMMVRVKSRTLRMPTQHTSMAYTYRSERQGTAGQCQDSRHQKTRTDKGNCMHCTESNSTRTAHLNATYKLDNFWKKYRKKIFKIKD